MCPHQPLPELCGILRGMGLQTGIDSSPLFQITWLNSHSCLVSSLETGSSFLSHLSNLFLCILIPDRIHPSRGWGRREWGWGVGTGGTSHSVTVLLVQVHQCPYSGMNSAFTCAHDGFPSCRLFLGSTDRPRTAVNAAAALSGCKREQAPFRDEPPAPRGRPR